MNPPAPRSLEILAKGMPVHALERNPGGSPCVLFLHGWLDHAHSFDWLCDALPAAWRTLCLDFRGHGLSGHLPRGAFYNYTDYFADVDGALDELQIPSAHLVGHSLGGSVALTYAAARPDRTASVTAIESLGTSGGPADSAVQRLRRFLSDLNKPLRKRIYPSVEAAAARVRENNSSYSEQAAFHMAKFGTRPVAGGVEFTFDSAHRRHFGFSFDEDQILAILEAIQCRVQILHGTSGFTFDDQLMARRLAKLGSPTPIPIQGGHHVHLDSPGEVARHVQRFVEGA